MAWLPSDTSMCNPNLHPIRPHVSLIVTLLAGHSSAQHHCEVLLKHSAGRLGNGLPREEGLHQALCADPAGGHSRPGDDYSLLNALAGECIVIPLSSFT